MKIKIKKTIYKEVEESTPCYVKSERGSHFYYVINENRAIQIFNGMSEASIGYVSASLAFSDNYKIIKQAKYKEVLQEALKKLSLLGIEKEEI